MKETTINNKLTTNNKLKLPTTWTKKKMASLFLMTWLSVNGTEAGQAFKNCLNATENSYVTYTYNALLDFDFATHPNITKNNGVLSICCIGTQCTASSQVCSVHEKFHCTKIDRGILCREITYCEGIVGDTPVTTNTIVGGLCDGISLSAISDHLATVPASQFKGLEKGYADYICPNAICKTIQSCNWDNNGWTCSYFDYIGGGCFLQWTAPWPGPADKNPYPLGSTTSSISSATTTIISIPASSPSSSDSTKKIFIPVGTIVGTFTVGGITYYLYKKRKDSQNQRANSQDGNMNDRLFELANVSQPTVKSENIGQPIFVSTPVEPEVQSRSTSLGVPVAWELSVPTEEAVSEEVSTDKLETYLGTVILKSTELSQLVIQAKQKIGPSLAVALETLLDTQTEITHGNNNFALRQLQREAKKELLTKLSEEEINHLCQLQKAVVQQEQLQAQIEISTK